MRRYLVIRLALAVLAAAQLACDSSGDYNQRRPDTVYSQLMCKPQSGPCSQ